MTTLACPQASDKTLAFRLPYHIIDVRFSQFPIPVLVTGATARRCVVKLCPVLVHYWSKELGVPQITYAKPTRQQTWSAEASR